MGDPLHIRRTSTDRQSRGITSRDRQLIVIHLEAPRLAERTPYTQHQTATLTTFTSDREVWDR